MTDERGLSVILFRTLASLAVAAGLSLGCNGPSPPDPSDPEVARGILQKALDSWKRGETPDAHMQSASVVVIEAAWKKGGQLNDYEIQSETEHAGYDVRFKVKLVVQEAGAAKKQNALYNVCTTPKLVVKRAEGGW